VLNERDIGSRLTLVQRHPQRVQDECGAHVARELPPDDPAAVGPPSSAGR
jgi:hypothetical protein